MASSVLVEGLEREDRERPVSQKRLIGPDVNYGRELLATLARRTGGWIGWEATSLRRMADEIAFVPLHIAGVRAGNDIEIGALVSVAFDNAIEARSVSTQFASLGRSLGFRQALRNSVLELRVAGVSPDTLQSATAPGSPSREVSVVLREYESLLVRSGITDSAGVFSMALSHFDSEAAHCVSGELLIAPTLVKRGLPGLLLARLVETGARVLDGDVPAGVEPTDYSVRQGQSAVSEFTTKSILAWSGAGMIPAEDLLDPAAGSVDMFVAATPTDELREVLRRIVGEGLRFDDVEIVTTDVDTYGAALDVLCQRVGLNGTMLHGIPLSRTRLGRALERWLTWLENGLPADLLRHALEAGELGSGFDAEPAAMARELRALRIGWGRARYEEAIRALGNPERRPPSRKENEAVDEYAKRVASRVRAGVSLHALLSVLLDVTPAVPERGNHKPVVSSVSVLARATSRWLELVHIHGAPEQQTADRIRTRLDALAHLDEVSIGFGSALATLRDALSDVRAWPLHTSDSRPWSATGGMVHLTDVAHGGTTGRPRVFVVGLDSDAAGGSTRQDPLLPDHVRAQLTDRPLATLAARRAEREFLLFATLASLRGRVTLSYASARSMDAGESGPAPVLLQVKRLLARNAAYTYAELRESLGTPACAVPEKLNGDRPTCPMDARDVWLHSLTDGALLLDGEHVVTECFTGLAAGIRARNLALLPELSAYTGLVASAAMVLDPRRRAGATVSPSALEKLAACPLAWFYRYGLGLEPTVDPEYDAEAWLGSADRGNLLHSVFERFTRRFASRRSELNDVKAESAMFEIVDELIAAWAHDVPPPGEVVFASEAAELRQAAFSFLNMERNALNEGDDATWSYFEYGFGGASVNGNYTLTDGSVLEINGRVDRIDARKDGTLRIVDYKTGSATRFGKSVKTPFNGGRQLQPAIYASVIADLLGKPVSAFEYRFPSLRGANEVIAYSSVEMATARPIVTALLGQIKSGAFIPTNDSGDCKYCDTRAICRVEQDKFGKVTSPRAAWAEASSEFNDAYAGMLAARTKQDQ